MEPEITQEQVDEFERAVIAYTRRNMWSYVRGHDGATLEGLRAVLRSTAARVRNEALEEAAKVADAEVVVPRAGTAWYVSEWQKGNDRASRNIATKIRALRATSETESNPKEKA